VLCQNIKHGESFIFFLQKFRDVLYIQRYSPFLVEKQIGDSIYKDCWMSDNAHEILCSIWKKSPHSRY